jgi:hypothetical protein
MADVFTVPFGFSAPTRRASAATASCTRRVPSAISCWVRFRPRTQFGEYGP